MCLKSNMDRFIVKPPFVIWEPVAGLKSNMDRFIVQLRLNAFAYKIV